MTLYSADISKLAVPVKKIAYKKQTKKVKSTEPETKQETIPLESEEISEPVKKTRKRKTNAKVAEAPPVAQEEKPAPKKRAPKKKVVEEPVVEEPKPVVKKKRVQKPKISEEMDVDVEEPVKPVKQKPKPKAKKEVPAYDASSAMEPPPWFNKYVESVKKEQAQMLEKKVPQKQVKQEAQEVAARTWNDGMTRDRVSNEVDNHMSRMYSMIFKK